LLEIVQDYEDREQGAATVTPSLDTWKAEFYPIEAKDVSEEDAGAHAALKWSGLTKENLDKHNIHIDEYHCIVDSKGSFLEVGSHSCVWCIINARDEDNRTHCNGCPGKLFGDYGSCLSEWYTWERDHDPVPMIDWIEDARKGIDQAKIDKELSVQTEYEKGYIEGIRDGYIKAKKNGGM